MHPYYWSRKRLRSLLPQFHGGQFRLAKLTPEEEPDQSVLLMFHGEIRSISIPDMTAKKVVIESKWLYTRSFFFDANEKLQTRWTLVTPRRVREIPFDFIVYYPQPNRNDRLKLKGCGREFCRFYRRGDPATLKETEDGLLPLADIQKTPGAVLTQ